MATGRYLHALDGPGIYVGLCNDREQPTRRTPGYSLYRCLLQSDLRSFVRLRLSGRHGHPRLHLRWTNPPTIVLCDVFDVHFCNADRDLPQRTVTTK